MSTPERQSEDPSESHGSHKRSVEFNIEKPPLHVDGAVTSDLVSEAAMREGERIDRPPSLGKLLMFLIALLLIVGAVVGYFVYQWVANETKQLEANAAVLPDIDNEFPSCLRETNCIKGQRNA